MPLAREWLDRNIEERKKWVTSSLNNLVETTKSPAWSGGKIHPLELSLSVQKCMTDQDILVFDGGNTHFWSEIAVNINGLQWINSFSNNAPWLLFNAGCRCIICFISKTAK